MPFSEFQRFIRKGLVILLGIYILLISLISVTIVKFKDDSLNSVLTSNIDCLNVNYTDTDLIAEKSLIYSLKVKTACFCQSSINSVGSDNTAKLSLSDNSLPCSNYVDLYSSYNYYKLVLAVVLPILNLAFNSLKSKFKLI
jgi:hypothetical protein